MTADPVPAHHYRCDDAYGCDWHGSELVPDPDGVLRCPACSSVAIIEPPATSSPAFPARRASPTPEPGHSEPPAERRTAMSSNTPPPAGLSAAQIEFCAEDGEWGGPCCPFCSASPEGQHRDDCAWAKSAWTRERIAKGIAAALRALHAAPKPTAGLVEAVREWQRVNEHRRRPRFARRAGAQSWLKVGRPRYVARLAETLRGCPSMAEAYRMGYRAGYTVGANRRRTLARKAA